ncbi:hypothetical protein C7M84_016671 [Penaeus vannamei]|uniref:Uncharacterized protein n=1 Tax=Penaeus vannamei TaxID=6689 RepID=A0A3R7LWX6_PENVA|nr:hypothetical protein C7M84_016671 [Penaeus vannamei]
MRHQFIILLLVAIGARALALDEHRPLAPQEEADAPYPPVPGPVSLYVAASDMGAARRALVSQLTSALRGPPDVCPVYNLTDLNPETVLKYMADLIAEAYMHPLLAPKNADITILATYTVTNTTIIDVYPPVVAAEVNVTIVDAEVEDDGEATTEEVRQEIDGRSRRARRSEEREGEATADEVRKNRNTTDEVITTDEVMEEPRTRSWKNRKGRSRLTRSWKNRKGRHDARSEEPKGNGRRGQGRTEGRSRRRGQGRTGRGGHDARSRKARRRGQGRTEGEVTTARSGKDGKGTTDEVREERKGGHDRRGGKNRKGRSDRRGQGRTGRGGHDRRGQGRTGRGGHDRRSGKNRKGRLVREKMDGKGTTDEVMEEPEGEVTTDEVREEPEGEVTTGGQGRTGRGGHDRRGQGRTGREVTTDEVMEEPEGEATAAEVKEEPEGEVTTNEVREEPEGEARRGQEEPEGGGHETGRGGHDRRGHGRTGRKARRSGKNRREGEVTTARSWKNGRSEKMDGRARPTRSGPEVRKNRKGRSRRRGQGRTGRGGHDRRGQGRTGRGALIKEAVGRGTEAAGAKAEGRGERPSRSQRVIRYRDGSCSKPQFLSLVLGPPDVCPVYNLTDLNPETTYILPWSPPRLTLRSSTRRSRTTGKLQPRRSGKK